ncbi:MAG: hypothetical protein I3274_02795 [Candidatus Moeniiplasma glomeromycotorum]|nr:hypothetical protein [Candidatus Moeniiplasma glomeromycotorum]MCE8167533.1 hypothetical protein [Candidatus Moeniiplasma glomeromycotorum]
MRTKRNESAKAKPSFSGATKSAKAKVNLKATKRVSKRDLEFERYLERVEDVNYRGGSWALPRNATAAEKTKYEICEKILGYQEDNNLSDEIMARKLHLTITETKDILFCRISKFSLDYLINIAKELFSPSEIKLTIENNKTSNKRRKTTHVQTV